MTSVEFIPGPFTREISREKAEQGLQEHPAIRKGASYAIDEIDGRYVAAIVHEAAPPFGGPDEEEASPPPGPSDSGSDSPDDSGSDGPPAPDDGGDSDGPPKKEKGGDKELLHQVMDALTQIGAALGVPIGLGDSPVPGPDGDPGMGGPPGAGGPPGGPPGAGGPPAPDVKMHERAMKPGETPPGGTPLGAPAFASVRPTHPWAHLAGKVASFRISDEIGDAPMEEVTKEVTALANEIGYRAKVREGRDDQGNRIATAVITAH